jgi:hypothetical protein
VIDRANRAGVVLYALDPKGLATMTRGEGSDVAQRRTPNYTNEPMRSAPLSGGVPMEQTAMTATNDLVQRSGMADRQESLRWLAEQTGGFAVVSQNDISRGIGRIVDDTRGYYLIGFDTATPRGARAEESEVKIRVKRKGLDVRARRDRFGPADPDAVPPPPPADPLLSAALSPFATGTLDVRIAALFGHDATEGDYVRALVAIDPAGLTLAETAGGGREGNLTLLVFALDDQGIVVGQTREVVDVRLDAAAYDRARQHGLRYGVLLPFKKAGGYQIRAAVLDERSQAIGASAQFVEVPRVGQKRVALSGIVLAEPGGGGTPLTTTFAPGSRVEYRGTLYDGQRLGGGFSVSATVLRDGTLVHAIPPAALAGAPPDAPAVAPIPFRGTLALGDDFAPGLYTLQVTIEPEINGKKSRPVRQWVDFEVR